MLSLTFRIVVKMWESISHEKKMKKQVERFAFDRFPEVIGVRVIPQSSKYSPCYVLVLQIFIEEE